MHHAFIAAFAAASVVAPSDPVFRAVPIPLPGPAQRLEVAPLDGDAAPDAVVVLGTGVADDARLAILRGLGDGSFAVESVETLFDLGYIQRPDLALADLDGDGVLDVGLSTVVGQVRLGDGTLGFTAVDDFPNAGGEQFALGLSDRDGDGDLDSTLMLRDFSTIYFDYGENDGTGQFTLDGFHEPGLGSPGYGDLLYVDADGDGLAEPYAVDAAALSQGTSATELVKGRFGEVASGDLDGDGAPDLVVADTERHGVRVLLNDGAGSFPADVYVATGRAPENLAVGDLSGDGALDVVVTNRGAGTLTLLVGDGAGGFAIGAVVAVGVDPLDVALADLDVDGDLDVVVAHGISERLTVLLSRRLP